MENAEQRIRAIEHAGRQSKIYVIRAPTRKRKRMSKKTYLKRQWLRIL